MIREASSSNSGFKQQNCGVVQDGFRIEIEIYGDYLKWTSFRDIFAAVYINNNRLSKVEKMFQRNAKTSVKRYCVENSADQ